MSSAKVVVAYHAQQEAALDARITSEVDALNSTITSEAARLDGRIDTSVATLNTKIATDIAAAQTSIAANISDVSDAVAANKAVYDEFIAGDFATVQSKVTNLENEVTGTVDAYLNSAIDKTLLDTTFAAAMETLNTNDSTLAAAVQAAFATRIDQAIEERNAINTLAAYVKAVAANQTVFDEAGNEVVLGALNELTSTITEPTFSVTAAPTADP